MVTTQTKPSQPATTVAVHHIGMTVADVDRSLAFWKEFLGAEPRWRRVLDGNYLAGVTGYPGVKLDASIVELPGGAILELLDYQTEDKAPNDMGTANPGNVHLCLQVDDIDTLWQRAVAAGATPMSPEPNLVTTGPNKGAKAGYLRDPDGITIELFQPPPQMP